MSVLDAVRKFIKNKCPCLGTYKKSIGVDQLGEDPVAYVIEPLPVDPIVSRYVNGDTVRRFSFVFASTRYYGSDVLTNIENSDFFYEFADWMERCSRENDLPDLGEGKDPWTLKATDTGYLINEQTNTARYQIECELDYYQEAINGSK